MKLALIATIAVLGTLSGAAHAVTSSSTFSVGITIAHECRVDRMPDGATTIALECDADAESRTAVRTLATAAAWPRASEPVAGAPRRLQEVAMGDASRMIVVEY